MSTTTSILVSGSVASLGINPWLLALIVVWTLVWKGMALWKAGRLSQKKWFIALLVINTLGILDIIYIYFVARKYTVEVEEK